MRGRLSRCFGEVRRFRHGPSYRTPFSPLCVFDFLGSSRLALPRGTLARCRYLFCGPSHEWVDLLAPSRSPLFYAPFACVYPLYPPTFVSLRLAIRFFLMMVFMVPLRLNALDYSAIISAFWFCRFGVSTFDVWANRRLYGVSVRTFLRTIWEDCATLLFSTPPIVAAV